MRIPIDQRKPAPGIRATLLFRGKVLVLQARRAARESKRSGVKRHDTGSTLIDKPVIAQSRTPVWTPHEAAENALVAGKIQNLRLAIRRLNGVEVPAHAVFSFWKQVGRTNRLKGYVAGRELREGCLIPSIGGGLCQLSNALYDAALQAGFEIVERHAHSQVIPGSLAETGRDATVFWNYVDLRFRSHHAFRIEAELTVDKLVVRFRGEPVCKRNSVPALPPQRLVSEPATKLEDCLTCDQPNCFRQAKSHASGREFGRAAYLVDEYWPEFDRYLGITRRRADLLCIPFDGKRFRKPNYDWTTAGFGEVKTSPLLTLSRARESRKLASQGANRQRALLAAHEQLAKRYSALLPYDVAHVVLTQSLLPFFWRRGDLGGRTFDVLMTGLPLAILHDRLDAAFRLHPESRTLADFRADASLVAAESEALRHAHKIVTPHTEIAALYPEKSVLVDWAIPPARARINNTGPAGVRLVFPATTVGRKGVYELRDAICGLNVQLVILGPVLEAPDFWDGLRVTRLTAGEDWLAGATAVVLPAFVEHKPRRLLEAAANGVPVIASTACGLGGVSGVTTVRAGDVDSLRSAIESVMDQANPCRPDSSSGSQPGRSLFRARVLPSRP
jgi:glycosyltransferase involved in cell wall biosynthesis